jgi:hypothetical protein
MLISPIELLKHTRFDVIIKYLYAKSILREYKTPFYKELYKAHLKCWNNFKEYNNPDKNTFEKFDNTFIQLISDLNSKGFDPGISKIAVQDGKFLLNGSHRLAAALATNKNLYYYNGVDGKDGQLVCDYTMFNNLKLDNRYMDLSAIEYAKLKPTSLVVCLFPVCNSDLKAVIKTISNYSNIFYTKDLTLSKQGAFNLMRELYLGEAWAGNWKNDYDGFRAKANLCFPGNDYKMTAVLIDIDDVNIAVHLKAEIRNMFKIGKHSVHINDTHEQTVRIAKTLFNDNSIHFLCNSKTVNYTNFREQMNLYAKLIYSSKRDADELCVTASSTLAAYGLREGADIDYLHLGDPLPKTHKISSHNDYGIGLYNNSAATIVSDPDLHFYHRGLKFTSLDQVKQLKQKRGEVKDVSDIELIDSII